MTVTFSMSSMYLCNRRKSAGVRRVPPVPLLVSELTGDGQIGPGGAESADQPVHVSAQRASVGRHPARQGTDT